MFVKSLASLLVITTATSWVVAGDGLDRILNANPQQPTVPDQSSEVQSAEKEVHDASVVIVPETHVESSDPIDSPTNCPVCFTRKPRFGFGNRVRVHLTKRWRWLVNKTYYKPSTLEFDSNFGYYPTCWRRLPDGPSRCPSPIVDKRNCAKTRTTSVNLNVPSRPIAVEQEFRMRVGAPAPATREF